MEKKTFIQLCGVVCIALLWLVTSWLSSLPVFSGPAVDSIPERLAYVIKWMTIPGFCLITGIAAMAMQRIESGHGISGTRTPQWHSMEINLRFNQNTLEQTVLASIAWLGLGLQLPLENVSLVGVFAFYFAVGRALFWIGYLQSNAEMRAPGFALTFLPTVGSYIWLVYSYVLKA